MIDRSTDIKGALRSRQRGFLLNPFRFGGTPPGDTDPYFSNVSLLLHMDGANGSTTFTDSSGTPKTVSGTGGAKISTTHSKFGGASLLLNGTSGYLSTPGNSAFAFGTGDFCVEMFIRTTAMTERVLVDQYDGDGSWQFSIRNGKLSWYSDSYVLAGSSLGIADNALHHVAADRSSGVLRFFVDGVQDGSVSLATNYTKTPTLAIGAQVFSGAGSWFPGNIDELRITKGVSRYTANFTPPAAPFPNS